MLLEEERKFVSCVAIFQKELSDQIIPRKVLLPNIRKDNLKMHHYVYIINSVLIQVQPMSEKGEREREHKLHSNVRLDTQERTNQEFVNYITISQIISRDHNERLV